jgi:hypothetical protein
VRSSQSTLCSGRSAAAAVVKTCCLPAAAFCQPIAASQQRHYSYDACG